MNKKNHVWSFLSLATLFIVLWTICNMGSVSSFAEAVLSVLVPILAGFAIAFILNIPLRFTENLWIKWFSPKRRKLRRAICIILSLLFVLGIFALLLGIIIPQMFFTVRDRMIPRVPFYIEELQMWYGNLAEWAKGFSVELPPLNITAESVMSLLSEFALENKNIIIDQSVSFATTAFSVVFDTIFAIAIAIYVLAQKERLGRQSKKILYSIFSEKNAERVITLARLTEKTFSKFISGQLTEAVIIGVLCFIGMLIFRMPYALIVSVLVGTTALIPIFGAFIGTGIGAVLILFESPVTALWFVLFIIILQQIEGNVIYPKVVGTNVGLPGLWVLVAVTIGTEFGIVGMLVAVPVASLLYTVTRQIVNATLKKKGFDGIFAEEEEPPKKPKREKRRKKKKKSKNANVSAEDAPAPESNTDPEPPKEAEENK